MTWQKQAGYGLVGFATGAISTLVLFHLTDLILTLLVGRFDPGGVLAEPAGAGREAGLMNQQRFTYRADEAFTEAVLTRLAGIEEHRASVLVPTDIRLHPHRPVMQYDPITLALDARCVGFQDAAKNDKPPLGLVRSQACRYLYPRKTVSGDRWRQEIDQLNHRPMMADVFAEYGVEITVFPRELHRIFRVGLILDTDDHAVWLSYGAEPASNAHLLPCPPSEYLLASERLHARQLAKEPAS